MRRRTFVFLWVLSVSLLSGCVFFTVPTLSTTATPTTSLTFSTQNGTITVVSGDYGQYPPYQSPAYSLEDVEQYNQVLLDTRDAIIASNIQISATMYRTVTILPGITRQIVASSSSGSGVLFHEDENFLYALTNFHVIDPGEDAPVYQVIALGDAVPSSATVICFDAALDLAVIQFEKGDRTEIELADLTTRLNHRMNEGELVMAVGNPSGLENNVTFGEVVAFVSVEDYAYPVLQHSAMIDNGSSGGALVDVDGHLLGINTWGSETDPMKSFAIPIYLVYVFLYNHGLCE